MPLSIEDQYQVALGAWQSGDFDLMSRVLTDPGTVTPKDQQTMAEQLGLKGGFLSAAVNVVSDPTVWIAALLSRRFPTSQYLRGAIPHRFIGTANEFTGLSTVARTVEGFFRGTNISKLIGLKMRREGEVTQIGNKIFDLIERRANWKEEMPVVSLLMEGRNPAGATPELRQLSDQLRGHMNDLWKFLQKTHKVSGGFEDQAYITRATSRPFTPREAPRFLRDYLPHIPLTGNESTLTLSGSDALKKFARSRSAQAMQLSGQNPAGVWELGADDRLTSNFHRYQNFLSSVQGQVFNGRLFRRHRLSPVLETPEGKELFITDLNVILQRYVHSVARTYSLNAPLTQRERMLASTLIEDASGQVVRKFPTSEPIIAQIVNQGLDASSNGQYIRQGIPGTKRVLERLDLAGVNHPSLGALKTLVRNVMGLNGEDEILFGNLFNGIRSRVSGLRGVLGQKGSARLEDAMSTLQRRQRDRDLMNRVTSYFYATTLGINPLSTLKNLFQPALTTVPSIGLGSTLEGYRVLKQRVPRYAREFIHQKGLLASKNIPWAEKLNAALERAFNKTFPELSRYGIRADPRAFELDERALITDVSGKARFRNFDAYMKFLLQPFTQAELSNQVVTFYGGKAALRKALRRGEIELPALPPGAKAGETSLTGFLDDFLNEESAALVNSTQFRPGPGSRTVLQSHLPPPFRMFTSFPVRLVNHFAESTVRGALTDAQLKQAGVLRKLTGGRNVGTLARTYLTGKVVTDGLREGLGVDMSDALGITGSISNIAPSGQLFYPLPVPPLPGVLFSLASFATTRDPKELQPMILPFELESKVPIPKTLVPGGIAVSRVFRALRQYRPDMGGFVDENERLMFRGDTTDLIMGMLGIPLEKERRMRNDIERLNDTRVRMNRVRRRYATAVRNYDTAEMNRLEQGFREEFPDFGELQLTRQDRRRYDEQARLTAVQRAIRSIGKRASFLEADIYASDPDLIAQPGGF